MRRAITFARTGENFRIIHGPEVPLARQIEDFKRSTSQEISADEVEVWTSNGRIKRKKFNAPAAPVAVEAPLLETEDSVKSKKSK